VSFTMMVPPDITAYFQAVAPHATSELRLDERIVSALRNLRYEDAASRKSTAVALLGIQAQLGALAATVTSVRSPARLADAHAARLRAIKQMASAAGEVANALTGDAAARSKRIETARQDAVAAEASTRSGASSITAALGVAAAAAATIPVVGQIIGAILMLIAAIIVLIAQVLSKSKEEDAAKKERKPEPKRKDDDD
jgi:hypothetical protein